MVAFLLLLVALAPVASWLFEETHLVSVTGLVGPNTVAFVMLKLGEDDPGVRDLVNHVVSRLPVAQDGPLAGYRWPVQSGTEVLPVHLIVTADLPSSPAASPAEPTLTGALCFSHTRGLNQVIFMNLKHYAQDKGERIERYRDRELLSLAPVSSPAYEGPVPAPSRSPLPSASPKAAGPTESNQAWLAFIANSFVISGRLEGAQAMVDRIQARSGTFKGTGALARMYARLNPTQDAVGVVTGERGELRRILEGIAQDEARRGPAAGPRITPDLIRVASSGVSAVGFEADVLDADEVDVRLLVACNDEATAQYLRSYLETLVTELERAGMVRRNLAARTYSMPFKGAPAAATASPSPQQEWIAESRLRILHVKRLLPLETAEGTELHGTRPSPTSTP